VEVGSRRVIAGVSGSVRSLGALRTGVAEARSRGAELIAVLAWAPSGGEFAYVRAPCPLLLQLCEEAAKERIREAFDDALGGLPDDVAVQLLVVRARPGPVLVEFANKPDDLLVVGCGGRSLLGSTMRGSVTRYCVAHARCPVLAVPPPDLITDLRPWPHRWRPEVLAGPRAGTATVANRPDAGTSGGSEGRAAASASSASAAAPPTGADSSGRQSAWVGDQLPAYRGAPYYQPRQPSRACRALRHLRVAVILAAAFALAAISWVMLTQSAGRP
jgi:nucleotide-binding universal stress UspA family protein